MRKVSTWWIGRHVFLFLLLGIAALSTESRAEPLTAAQLEQRLHNPNALWEQVQKCLAEKVLEGSCRLIDRRHQFVILHDIDPEKADSYMIVPTFEVTGIEDPKAWQPPVADFWKYGFEEAKRFVGKPATDTGLAINSVAGRGQNQLHIHISCVKKAVREVLMTTHIPTVWKLGALTLEGHAYDAIKVASLDKSPFLVLQELRGAEQDMGAQSLAVIGAEDGGFYVLDTSTTKTTKAEAEELLDETCSR